MASAKLQTTVVLFYFLGFHFSWYFILGTPSSSLAVGARRWEPLRYSRTKKQAAKCSSEEWSCEDGDCVSIDQFCDGEKNCKDGSDETRNTCFSIMCPKYLFQCAYGACVDGDAQCNGVSDCADGSDEGPNICGDTSTTIKPTTSFESLFRRPATTGPLQTLTPPPPQLLSEATPPSPPSTTPRRVYALAYAPQTTVSYTLTTLPPSLSGRPTLPQYGGYQSMVSSGSFDKPLGGGAIGGGYGSAFLGPNIANSPRYETAYSHSWPNTENQEQKIGSLPSMGDSSQRYPESQQMTSLKPPLNLKQPAAGGYHAYGGHRASGGYYASGGYDSTSGGGYSSNNVQTPILGSPAANSAPVANLGSYDGRPTLNPFKGESLRDMCLLPTYPVNGYYLAVSDGFPGDVQRFVKLDYSCDEGYNLVGVSKNQCFSGSWYQNHPVCERMCKPLLTQDAQCSKAKNPCDTPQNSRTAAVVTCTDKFNLPVQYTMLTCVNGKWSNELPACARKQDKSRMLTKEYEGTSDEGGGNYTITFMDGDLTLKIEAIRGIGKNINDVSAYVKKQ